MSNETANHLPEQPRCEKHCEHDPKWMSIGRCGFVTVIVEDRLLGDIAQVCGHRCTFAPETLPAANEPERHEVAGKCLQCGNRTVHNFSCGYNVARPDGESPVLDSEREAVSVPATQRPVECANHCGHDPITLDFEGNCSRLVRGSGATGWVRCGHRCCVPAAALPVDELKPDDNGEIYYPGIVDQKTLSACLGTAEQIICDGVVGTSGVEKIQRFRQTREKLIAQVKSHPMSFDEWNARAPLPSPQGEGKPAIPEMALYWLRNAKDASYSLEERFFWMEQAYNHVVNALLATRQPQGELERELAEIKARLNKATPGPWTVFCPRNFYCQDCDMPDAQDADGFVSKVEVVRSLNRQATGADFAVVADVGLKSTPENVSDAEFIAHARTDIPYLLDLVTTLTAENARLVAQNEVLQQWHDEVGIVAKQIAFDHGGVVYHPKAIGDLLLKIWKKHTLASSTCEAGIREAAAVARSFIDGGELDAGFRAFQIEAAILALLTPPRQPKEQQ